MKHKLVYCMLNITSNIFINKWSSETPSEVCFSSKTSLNSWPADNGDKCHHTKALKLKNKIEDNINLKLSIKLLDVQVPVLCKKGTSYHPHSHERMKINPLGYTKRRNQDKYDYSGLRSNFKVNEHFSFKENKNNNNKSILLISPTLSLMLFLKI